MRVQLHDVCVKQVTIPDLPADLMDYLEKEKCGLSLTVDEAESRGDPDYAYVRVEITTEDRQKEESDAFWEALWELEGVEKLDVMQQDALSDAGRWYETYLAEDSLVLCRWAHAMQKQWPHLIAVLGCPKEDP